MNDNTKALLAVGAIVVVFAVASSVHASENKPGIGGGVGGGAGSLLSPDGRAWTPLGREQVRLKLLGQTVVPDAQGLATGIFSGQVPTGVLWKLAPGVSQSISAAQQVTLALSAGSTVYTDPLLTTLLFTTDTAGAAALGWPILLARPGDAAPF